MFTAASVNVKLSCAEILHRCIPATFAHFVKAECQLTKKVYLIISGTGKTNRR